VIYLAGADPFEGDRLGRLALSFEGLKARDQRVFEWAWQRRVPLAFAMAGGYGVNIDDTVQVQMNTYALALAYWQRWQRWQQSQHWQNQEMSLNPKPQHPS
jgi:acetoin utilization deacetylase AcuC-like enzyme